MAESSTKEPESKPVAPKKNPVALWITLGVTVVLGVLWDRVSLPNAKDRFERVPLEGMGYQGKDLALNEVELKVFGQADVLNRVYAAGSQKFILTIIDGTNFCDPAA